MKRFIQVFTVILSLTFSFSVVANPQDEVKIKQLFKNYMDKYNHYIQTGNLEYEPSVYGEEVMLISDTSSPVIIKELALYGQVEKFLDRLKKRGVTKVRWEKSDIHMLGVNMAIASNIAVRYNAQGEVVDRVGASYNLFRKDGNWRIVAFAIHPVVNAFYFAGEPVQ